MEVFITEKEEVSDNYIGKHFEYGQLSNSQSSTVALIFNTDWESLEKHEAEVRKQVYDEVLYELQDIYDNLAEDGEDWYVADKITNLMQKLAECKDKEITVIINGNVGIDVAIQGALTCKDIQGNVDCQGNIKVVK